MNLPELKKELEKRIRQLKNADPEQVGFLKKKIKRLEDDIKTAEAEQIQKGSSLAPLDIVVKGKKITFDKAGVARLPYKSILKRIDQKNYIIIYNSSTSEDAELHYSDGQWTITCCSIGEYPEFEYEDLGLAITYILDKMHSKYSVEKQKKPKAKPTKKPKDDQNSHEDVEELKRYLTILQELKEESVGSIAKKQIQKEIDSVANTISELEK